MTITTNTLSYLQNSEKIPPMLLLEVPTTVGRTYHAYKHGGEQAGKERIFEETLGAAVWLFGAAAFNKIGDFIGKNLFNLKDLDIDVGKDSLRDPFSYVNKNKHTACAVFKFTKIATSSILGIAAMGYVVPKLKKAVTNANREKAGLPLIPDRNGKYEKGWADKFVGLFIKQPEKTPAINPQFIDIKNFIETSKNTNGAAEPSFGGNSLVNGLLYASHNLENNTAWRLLSTDMGTTAGRVTTSRTKKEAAGYAFRDSTSSLAYIFAAPAFSSMLKKTTNTPNVQPKVAEITGEYLSGIINKKGSGVSPGYFSSEFSLSKNAKEIFDKIKFNDEKTVTLFDFNAQTGGKYAAKADLMSKLQPLYHNERILSQKQVEDILSNSHTSNPEFLNKAMMAASYGKSNDERKFVSRKNLENARNSIDDFVRGLENYAKKKNVEINSNLINKYTKNLNRKNLLFHMAGVGFAIFCLAFLIPKLQYLVLASFDSKEKLPQELKSNKNVENS